MNKIITIKKLNFYFGRKHVLNNINVEFDAHSITAIIGPSGSGKSTLLRTMNRIFELYPEQYVTGEIYLHGNNIFNPKIDLIQLRRQVGMVMQKPTPFPMSIFDNVAFAVKLHEKIPKTQIIARVEKALKEAALWDEVKERLHTAATQLSGGQQQRLCIARSIAINPEILLLDEPTSALDPIATAKIEELIQQLKSQYTIIMVTHNLKQAQRVSDTTLFMQEGEIIEINATHELFNQPQNMLTKKYIEMT